MDISADVESWWQIETDSSGSTCSSVSSTLILNLWKIGLLDDLDIQDTGFEANSLDTQQDPLYNNFLNPEICRIYNEWYRVMPEPDLFNSPPTFDGKDSMF